MINKNLQYSKQIIISIILLIIINSISEKYPIRLDLTADQRYTLSETTKNIVDKIDKDLLIKVYLKGDFPLDFKRLQQETKQHLTELNSLNSHIYFRFIDPKGMENKLIKEGLQPSRLTMEEEGVISETIIFPWAIISYKNKKARIPLLLNIGDSQKEQLQNSIENIEYAFSKALLEIITNKTKSIAILRGNGELADVYLYDFLSSLKEEYSIAPFTLDKENDSPQKLLTDLKKYDLTIIAKPTIAFTEEEKLILDQYITNGGKTLWMLDTVHAEIDSLRQTGESLFTPRELNLTDLLFSYGVRVNYNLVEDLYSSKIAIATGNIGNKTQFKPFLWRYYPLIIPNTNHAITKKLEAINMRFPTNIDTLKNNIKKVVLLESSPLTKMTGLPNIISLGSIADNIQPELYTSNPQILGVLLEGKFKSAYQHRTKAFETNFIPESLDNKMVVISDGDLARNQIQEGQPTRMDVDKWTGQHFGNKNFLMNTVDYLLDDTGLLALRGKSLDIKILNKKKVREEKGFWQFITIVLPLVLLGLFGFGFNLFLKRKYS